MTETTTVAVAEAPTTLTPAERAVRLARAETLVKDHMLMSAAVGLVPVPVVDLLGGIGIQVALVKRLATLYGVPFSHAAVRGIVTSLIGSLGVGALATGVWSAVKFLPVLGGAVGAVSMPIALAAVTYAIGKLFVAHFEVGGTLADFNVAAKRPYFRELLHRGRETASSMTGSAAAKDPAQS